MATPFETLIGTLFFARDYAHRAHLKTKSYAQHVALGDFYEAIIGHADDLTEMRQGADNKLLDIPWISSTAKGEPADVLEGQLMWIQGNRKKFCDDDCTALQNIIDEVEELYMKTLYKLRFLS